MSKITLARVVLGVIAGGWVLEKIWTSFRRESPLGYEDEGGFHFGSPSRRE